jgi:uncharacterized protein
MKLNKILSIALVLLLLTGFVAAREYPNLNNKLVNDFAGLMTPEQEQSLTDKLLQINQASSVEIAVVTVQSTNGEDRLDFANHLGENNGVGKKATDNGVVLLWSVDNENGGAIAPGRGIESILNDAKVVRIGKGARPLFDQGKVYEGFVQMIDGVKSEVDKSGEYQGLPTAELIGSSATLEQNTELPPIVWLIILIIGAIIIIALLSSVTSDDFGGGGGSFRGGGYIGGGFSGGSFSSGGGGGGFSFGGGSFGGGGGHF